MKNRKKISTSSNFWKTYFRYTMYQYSDGRVRILRDCDKKLVYECIVEAELDEEIIKEIWTRGALRLDENKD